MLELDHTCCVEEVCVISFDLVQLSLNRSIWVVVTSLLEILNFERGVGPILAKQPGLVIVFMWYGVMNGLWGAYVAFHNCCVVWGPSSFSGGAA